MTAAPPTPPVPHLGVILAGGRSRRMGRDKATLALPGGTTMIERVAAALAACCAGVIVSGRTPAVPTLRRLADRHPDAGPLAGIEAVLSSGLAEAYLVCPCDMPFVTAAILRELLRPSTAAATVFHIAGEAGFRPLPVRITPAALPVVRRRLEAGQRKVIAALAEVGVEAVRWEDEDGLANVNTPAEYQRLLER